MKAPLLILNSIKSVCRFLPALLIAIALFGFQTIAGQTKVEPKPKIAPTPPARLPLPRRTTPPPRTVAVNESPMPAEKSIVVEPKVNISLCVTEGRIKINGWDREEVRAMVSDGSEVGYKVAEKNARSGKPVWIFVLGFDPAKTAAGKPDECLSGSEIEIDVPRGAIVNLKSGESETVIESIRKASVRNVGGDIFLRNIAEGVEAATYEGDVTVENSNGAMSLETAGGNIIALDVSPSEIGDVFRAKTKSGMITLKSVGHRQIETNSISGSTSFAGAFASGGQYVFGTQNGSIVLGIPAESSCRLSAWYGFGAFNSELPLANTVKQAQSLSAQLGAGECTLNLKTYSGSIRIRKQP